MFADYVKMAAKLVLVGVITFAIIALFSNVHLPSPDFTGVYVVVGKGLAIIDYWFPLLTNLWSLCLGLLGIRIAIYLFKFAMIAVKWIMKVNE